MKLCDRCPLAARCSLDYLGRACRHARAENAPWLEPNNAEVLSNMDVDSLAQILYSVEYRRAIDGGGARWQTPDDVIDWLLSPAKSENEVSGYETK